jgi:peptide/nickel transport system permease protein
MTSRSQVIELPEFASRPRSGPSAWSASLLWFCRRKPLAAFGGAVVLLLLVCAVFASQIAPYGYDIRDYSSLLSPPSLQHFLGTDDVGRDIFSRIVYGARVSVIVGFGTVTISTIVAGLVGIPAGYFGGKYDLTAQRIVDMWLSTPPLVLLITFAAVFGTPTSTQTILASPFRLSLQPAEIRTAQIILVLGFILAGGSSRVFRSATISVRNNQYNEAARALGATDLHILLRYIVPNVAPVMLVIATVQLGTAILIEASLSFLQFGIPPPVPAWGSMLSGNATQFINRAPVLAVWPGLAISLAVFGFNMLGDGLRDVLDPRMRGSQ